MSKCLLYNPSLLAKGDLISNFVARTSLLDYFLDDLKRGGKQHHLVVGQRGTGKTSLLLRLAYAIEDDSQLSGEAIALRFPEEQYNIAKLSDFWLNCLDALADALDHRGETTAATEIEKKIEELEPRPETERQGEALRALTQWAEKSRRMLVLLIDNIDIVFTRLAKEHWHLRDILSEHREITLIGASSSFLDESSDYQSAFYDFFNLHELGALGEDEARRMLLLLSERAGTPRVVKVLEEEPGRFKALLLLSGGTPRTLAMLHGILAQESFTRAEEDLEALLDQLTPYYKARFDDLPIQSQQIVDAVALHWHPITAAECEARVRLGINATSSQLNRLVKQGVLAKVESGESARLTFQVAERLFNIWYLMRASRRMRRRLMWLVGYLQTFYGDADLERRANEPLVDSKGNLPHPLFGLGENKWLLWDGALTGEKAEHFRGLSERIREQFGEGILERIASGELISIPEINTQRDFDSWLSILNGDGQRAAFVGYVALFKKQQFLVGDVLARMPRDALVVLAGLTAERMLSSTDRDLASFFFRQLGDEKEPVFQQVYLLHSICAALAMKGAAGTAAVLLLEEGVSERVAPLYEAMKAFGAGLQKLPHLAPEVRTPAESIVAAFHGHATPVKEASRSFAKKKPPRGVAKPAKRARVTARRRK